MREYKKGVKAQLANACRTTLHLCMCPLSILFSRTLRAQSLGQLGLGVVPAKTSR